MTPTERIVFVRGNLDREAFAAKIGVSARTVQRWELDGELPKGKELAKIAEEFGINVHWLVTGEGEAHLKKIDIGGSEKTGDGITQDELALIRTLRFCGEEYKKRVYVAATVRAQRLLEERKIETKEKLKLRKDMESLSTASIE